MAKVNNFTLEDLELLDDAIKKGVKTVKYTDREITYRSISEMMQIRDYMESKICGKDVRGARRYAEVGKGTC